MSRARAQVLVLVVVLTTTSARAEQNTTVVNATGPQGAPVASRLREILERRHDLSPQPPPIATALEGRLAERPSFEAVRKAFADFRYQDAERLLGDLADALLASSSAEVIAPLAEVLWWQGLVAAVDDRETPTEQRRKSMQYFGAAFRLDAELAIDPSVTPPRVRLLMDEAKRARGGPGTLALEVDADGAELSIDGSPPAPFSSSVEVGTGLHLLRVSAPGRASVLRLVVVASGAQVRLAIELAPEAASDKVRRLIAETASVPEGRPRIPVLSRLGALVGVKQLLLIESVEAQRARIRLYDVGSKRMSQQYSFAQSDSSSSVALVVDRAFRLSDGTTNQRWYQRWPVWAGVGAVVAGGIVTALVINANQEPRIRGL